MLTLLICAVCLFEGRMHFLHSKYMADSVYLKFLCCLQGMVAELYTNVNGKGEKRAERNGTNLKADLMEDHTSSEFEGEENSSDENSSDEEEEAHKAKKRVRSVSAKKGKKVREVIQVYVCLFVAYTCTCIWNSCNLKP